MVAPYPTGEPFRSRPEALPGRVKGFQTPRLVRGVCFSGVPRLGLDSACLSFPIHRFSAVSLSLQISRISSGVSGRYWPGISLSSRKGPMLSRCKRSTQLRKCPNIRLT